MLNLAYTLPILTFFGLLVSAKDRHEVRGVVAGCVWVEYPYVKKCILCITPEASCSDVQTGIVFYVGCAAYRKLGSCETHAFEPITQDVSQLPRPLFDSGRNVTRVCVHMHACVRGVPRVCVCMHACVDWSSMVWRW